MGDDECRIKNERIEQIKVLYILHELAAFIRWLRESNETTGYLDQGLSGQEG